LTGSDNPDLINFEYPYFSVF